MKHKLHPHRPAMAALFALVASSTAPVFAQDISLTTPPPVVIDAPPPAVSAPPPAVITPAPVAAAPVARPAPPAPEVRAAPATTRSATRSVARTRTAAPARARPAPVAAAPEPAPAPVPVSAVPSAPAAIPPLPVAPAATAPIQAAGPVAQPNALAAYWPWLAAAGLLLLGALALVALRRRRMAHEEVYFEEPIYETAPEPAYAAPVAAAAIDEVAVSEPDSADLAALAASSEPVADRPWLEFLMRPVRAGTSGDEAVVEYELTVGNTGSAPAHDVRVSTWMVAAGEGSEMERSLIEPPAGATHSDLSIAPGDGARVEGAIALPREGLGDSVLPVVVADARYTLPDGGEGRTHASFAVGRAADGELEPFALDEAGLTEDVEARLHGEPERV
jgi:hypothetical protein